MPAKLDLLGQSFGYWTVTAQSEYRNSSGGVLWLCECVCGRKRLVDASRLHKGCTKSCGCITELKTHGLSDTKEYICWKNMLDRCKDKSDPRYGGRGIKVCDRWKNSIENFIADMGLVPEGCTINRIDNNGDYCPENCNWASRSEQANNRNISKRIKFNGRVLSPAHWALELGISVNAVNTRARKGWPLDTEMPRGGGALEKIAMKLATMEESRTSSYV